jgi:hypothetical protein
VEDENIVFGGREGGRRRKREEKSCEKEQRLVADYFFSLFDFFFFPSSSSSLPSLFSLFLHRRAMATTRARQPHPVVTVMGTPAPRSQLQQMRPSRGGFFGEEGEAEEDSRFARLEASSSATSTPAATPRQISFYEEEAESTPFQQQQQMMMMSNKQQQQEEQEEELPYEFELAPLKPGELVFFSFFL